MNDFENNYKKMHDGGCGYHLKDRGLFEVSGAEAVQFLNGLITNDVEKLEDGEQMLAAFPTLKGRLFAVVRVIKKGEKFLFETEEATREKVFENLFRFTFAGDFHVTDLTGDYQFFQFMGEPGVGFAQVEAAFVFGNDIFVPNESVDEFVGSLKNAVAVSDELYEVLRIEKGIPVYGIDMDEETVVPEIGFDKMISYEKGCYIGQEVIARIHFRGKPAKQLRGLVFESELKANQDEAEEMELRSADDKNAGNITSTVFSPKLGKTIALGYVRNSFLKDGTELKVGETLVKVVALPFC